MRVIPIFVALITAAPLFAGSLRQANASKRLVDSVQFCQIVEQAEMYNGRTIEVTGTYATAVDGNSFFDGDCDEARATFPGDTAGTVQALEKIAKFLKKRKTSEARITVIAVLRDDHASGVVRVGVSPYTFQVKKLLAISRVKH